MRDMSVSDSSRSGPGGNPFGPHARNDREDRYYDDEGGASDIDEEEQEAVRRQMEEEEEDAEAEELGKLDVEEPEIGALGSGAAAAANRGVTWPAPR